MLPWRQLMSLLAHGAAGLRFCQSRTSHTSCILRHVLVDCFREHRAGPVVTQLQPALEDRVLARVVRVVELSRQYPT